MFGGGGVPSVEYKSHPYYDDSDALDWLYLRPEDWTELEPGQEKALQDLLRANKPWLCELALSRIRAAAGTEYLAERPHPEVNEFLFFPIDETRHRVYVEYYFIQRPHAASPDGDFWWVIIDCVSAVQPFPTSRHEAYVVGLGWVVP
jgi:hypothetical protein